MSTVILVRKVVKHTKNKNSNELMHSSKEWPKIICCSSQKNKIHNTVPNNYAICLRCSCKNPCIPNDRPWPKEYTTTFVFSVS